MTNNDFTTSVSKLDAEGECKDRCSLTVHKKSPNAEKSVSLRWKKTDKGGEITVNIIDYEGDNAKSITSGGKQFIFDDPTKFSFYKNIDLLKMEHAMQVHYGYYFATGGKQICRWTSSCLQMIW